MQKEKRKCYIKRKCHIICEGESECNYITKVNKYFDDNNISYTFVPYNLKGCLPSKKKQGSYGKILEIFEKNVFKNNWIKGEDILIWLDNDLFKSKILNKETLRKKFSNYKNIKFIYSYENLEDFLTMHLSEDKYLKWEEICKEQNHFNIPMTGDIYEEKIKQILPNYSKYKLPSEIEINDDILKLLHKRQQDKNIHAKCDLINIILNKANKDMEKLVEQQKAKENNGSFKR